MDDKDMIYEQQQVELEVTRREDLERKTEFGRRSEERRVGKECGS